MVWVRTASKGKECDKGPVNQASSQGPSTALGQGRDSHFLPDGRSPGPVSPRLTLQPVILTQIMPQNTQ